MMNTRYKVMVSYEGQVYSYDGCWYDTIEEAQGALIEAKLDTDFDNAWMERFLTIQSKRAKARHGQDDNLPPDDDKSQTEKEKEKELWQEREW